MSAKGTSVPCQFDLCGLCPDGRTCACGCHAVRDDDIPSWAVMGQAMNGPDRRRADEQAERDGSGS